LIEQLDPPRWPRLGAALSVDYDVNGLALNGPGGLGGVDFPCAQLHHPHPADKLLIDLIRLYPHEVAVVLLGPATPFARALDRDSAVTQFLRRVAPFGIGASSSEYGVEGLYLQDVLGLLPLTQPGVVSTRPVVADVETRGELTRGLSVIDVRWSCRDKPNVD